MDNALEGKTGSMVGTSIRRAVNAAICIWQRVEHIESLPGESSRVDAIPSRLPAMCSVSLIPN